MKKLFLFLLLCNVYVVSASTEDAKPTCDLQASSFLMGPNLGVVYSSTMTFDECLEKGENLFNTIAENGSLSIHVRRNKITERSRTQKYKRVKIKYYEQDGSVIKMTLKRNDVEKSEVTKRTYNIESGWRCWTQGECEEIK